MKIESRVFLGVAVFCWLTATAYGIWTHIADGHIEWAGFMALILSGGLLGISGSFFAFVARRIEPRPEDRSDAEIAEAAGELGFFSPGSYWPFGLAGAAAVMAVAFAFVQMWLVIVSGLLLVFMIAGLLFEYYIGGRTAGAEH